jgi:hypothetical protein
VPEAMGLAPLVNFASLVNFISIRQLRMFFPFIQKNESPVGKIIDGKFTICAVVTGFSKHSNYPFDFLFARWKPSDEWESQSEHTLVKLLPNINAEAFKKKLYEHTFVKAGNTFGKINLIPLTGVYYKDPYMIRYVKFQHIFIFAGSGLLLILCSLFNYLTLFISRFNIRQREMALRTVYGASGRSLFALLSVEFIISLLVALLAGLFFINIMFSLFQYISDIDMKLSSIYLESLIYIGIVIIFSLLTFLLVLMIFRHRTLSSAIRRNNNKLFRKASVIVQFTRANGKHARRNCHNLWTKNTLFLNLIITSRTPKKNMTFS